MHLDLSKVLTFPMRHILMSLQRCFMGFRSPSCLSNTPVLSGLWVRGDYIVGRRTVSPVWGQEHSGSNALINSDQSPCHSCWGAVTGFLPTRYVKSRSECSNVDQKLIKILKFWFISVSFVGSSGMWFFKLKLNYLCFIVAFMFGDGLIDSVQTNSQ